MAYIDVDKFAEKICNFQAIDEDCANKMIWLLRTFPAENVEEKKDCEKCIHFGKHATEYPCSHCRNCYTDKFQPNDTRTPKERGGEK